MDKEQLGNLLKLLRKRKGLSQKELADLLYTSAPMVCKWEKGIFAPTSDMMLRIAQFYDIPVDYLYFPEMALDKLGNPSPKNEETEEMPSDETLEQSTSVVEREQSVFNLPPEKVEDTPSGETQKRILKTVHWPGVVAIAVIAVIAVLSSAAVIAYDTMAGTNESRGTASAEGYEETSELDEPVIVATAEFGDYALLLRLYDGQYESVYSLGPDFGANWTGAYELVLIDLYSGAVISQYPLTEWNEALRFQESFALHLMDLNSDGCSEVLIGQYAGSNYNLYKMYYIDADMQIGWYSEIGDLLISSQEMSPVLEVVEDKITYSFYNNASGETVTREIDLSALELD